MFPNEKRDELVRMSMNHLDELKQNFWYEWKE